MDIYNEQAIILIRRLAALMPGKETNLYPYIAACALDIICGNVFFFFLILRFNVRAISEAAMGLHVGAQEKKNSHYVDAILK